MKVIINGLSVEAREGQTILQAARENGIFIPSLCYHEKVGVAGKCRICVVEVEGMHGLQTSCSVAVREGMVVKTATEAVLNAQRLIVDLLLSSGTHDCLSCLKNSRCELQNAAYYLGVERPSMVFSAPKPNYDESSEFIRVDRNKCISCGRCVSACQNNVVNEVIDFAYRGHATQISFDDYKPMGESSCVQCGDCVQICPVGALIEKKAAAKPRAWETKAVRTTCPYCGIGCQIDLHVAGDQVVWASGNEMAEPNKGHLCVKGRFGYDFVYSPERLTSPMIRENGKLRNASWDEALDVVAAKFKQIIAESGADAIAGVSCARSINEDSYSMQKFFRAALKTNNIDHCART